MSKYVKYLGLSFLLAIIVSILLGFAFKFPFSELFPLLDIITKNLFCPNVTQSLCSVTLMQCVTALDLLLDVFFQVQNKN